MKPESGITYITDYSGFISCELFLVAWGTYTHIHTHMRINLHRSDFKKPDARCCGQHTTWFKNGYFVNILVQKKEMRFTMGMILVTAGKISVAMDTTEELFRTDEEHR